MSFTEAVELTIRAVEAAGVAVIVAGALLAAVIAGTRALQHRTTGERIYEEFRRRLGRAILLGLELLVAADIIHTVAMTPDLKSVGSLALIILVRTFLSWTLELEISGRWPWQKKPELALSPTPSTPERS